MELFKWDSFIWSLIIIRFDEKFEFFRFSRRVKGYYLFKKEVNLPDSDPKGSIGVIFVLEKLYIKTGLTRLHSEQFQSFSF